MGSGGFVVFAGPGRCVCRWEAARPRVPQTGPAGQTAWLSDTAIAFVRACLSGIGTVIAFADEKRAYLVQLSGAQVSLVSMVAVQWRALVLSFSKSPRRFAPCAKFSALLGLIWARARKSSPRALEMAHNRLVMACWAKYFAEMALEGVCWASCVAPPTLCPPKPRSRALFRPPGRRPGPAATPRWALVDHHASQWPNVDP